MFMFLKKLKTNLTQITFPDALNFSILWKNAFSLSHIETTKPQRPDSVVSSLPGANSFLQSVSSTICILYDIYEQSPRGLYFL